MRPTRRFPWTIAVLAAPVAGADAAERPAVPGPLWLDLAAATAPPGSSQPPPPAPPPPFGTATSARWKVQGGLAADFEHFDDNQFGLLGGGFSYFIAEGLSLEVELNALYVRQLDDDALGLNLNLLARWHFFTADRWSIYVDGGAGILGVTEEVPGDEDGEPGGANFGFTPQAGVGVSWEVAHDTRLLAGVRLHHISNARTHRDNPPRNSLFVYAELSFPF